MKIKSLLIGMLACTALVGCTNDDDVVVNNDKNEAIDAFVSVKLVMPETAYGRSVTDKGYQAGTDEERTINAEKSIFLFYDNAGNWITSGKLITQTPSSDEVKTDHSDIANSKYGEAYIALSGPEGELVKATQVLTVINYSACESLKQLTLAQALDKITSTTTDPITADGNFLMTTSTYFETTQGAVNDVDKNYLSNTTAITSENICATQTAAKENPVKIYVERAAAKVEVKYNSTAYDVDSDNENDVASDEANGAQGGDLVVDGNLQAVSISVKGVKLNNINEDTYLTKRLLTDWQTTAPFENWNYASNFRSYWAEGTKYNTTTWSKTENDVTSSVLTSYAYEDATVASETPMYAYEQTVATPNVVDDRSSAVAYPNVTTVLVAAEINVTVPQTTTPDDGTTTTTQVAYTGDLFQYGGVFYTESNYVNLILKQLQDAGYEKVATDGTTSDFAATDLDIVTDGTLAGIKFDVTNTTSTYQLKGETPTTKTVDEIEAYINGLDYVKNTIGYAGRKCYYQIPIEHLSSTGGAENGNYFYGLVRNHWYKLNISGVKHIGEAVFNPGVKIPQIPEKQTEYYMAVQLHVLSWHVMEQNVTLE